MYLYVELWKARPEWLNLPTEQRREYFKKVGSAIEALTEEGVDVVGFAKNDEETPHRSEHRYMAVWTMPSRQHAARLEESVAEAGWHDYFEQINARGELIAPQTALADLARLETTAGQPAGERLLQRHQASRASGGEVNRPHPAHPPFEMFSKEST